VRQPNKSDIVSLSPAAVAPSTKSLQRTTSRDLQNSKKKIPMRPQPPRTKTEGSSNSGTLRHRSSMAKVCSPFYRITLHRSTL